MDSKELKKDTRDAIPRYKVKRRSNNRNNWNTDSNSNNRIERNRSCQNGKGNQNTKQTIKSTESEDEEKMRRRANRFNNDNEKYNSTKNQYGYISRGEDNRLQRSNKDRVEFFNSIVSSFIRYANKQTSSSLSKDFDKLINKSGILPLSLNTSDLEPSTIDSTLTNLRKLREALLHEKTDQFSKKVFLFSIRVAVNIGHYQTYVPSIMHLLHPNNSLLLSDLEKQEISTLLVLHIAHFNHENSKALHLYFKYINKAEIKTLQILKSWINGDYYDWILFYNSETDNGKASIMKFGLDHMVSHMVKSITKSYFTFNLQDFEAHYLPNGSSYTELCEKYKTNWKLDHSSIVVRERNAR